MNWLDSLQQKPKAVRNRYAWFGAATATALVATVWVLGVPAQLQSLDTSAVVEESAQTSGVLSRFAADIKGGVAAALSGLGTSTPGVATTTPVATTSAAQPAVIIPTLTPETIKPAPRTIQIATTSTTSVPQ